MPNPYRDEQGRYCSKNEMQIGLLKNLSQTL